MSELTSQTKETNNINIMDALLYILAGCSMTIISVSFLMWLRF